MSTEQFDKAWKASPFEPFSVHLADGRSFYVDRPEFAGRPRGGRTIFISGVEDDAFDIIDLLPVTSISYSKPKNESRRRAS